MVAQACCDPVQIEPFRVLPVSELHGIAATECCRPGAEPAVQVVEAALLAARTVTAFVCTFDLELRDGVRPQIQVEQRRADTIVVAGELP